MHASPSLAENNTGSEKRTLIETIHSWRVGTHSRPVPKSCTWISHFRCHKRLLGNGIAGPRSRSRPQHRHRHLRCTLGAVTLPSFGPGPFPVLTGTPAEQCLKPPLACAPFEMKHQISTATGAGWDMSPGQRPPHGDGTKIKAPEPLPVPLQQFLGDCVAFPGEEIARGCRRLLASSEADRDGVTLVWKEIQDAVATGRVRRRTRLIRLAVVTACRDMRAFVLGGHSWTERPQQGF